jgi:hypothetical protein
LQFIRADIDRAAGDASISIEVETYRSESVLAGIDAW